MVIPKRPAVVHTRYARRAWRDLWELLAANEMSEEVYAPSVAVLAVELGLAHEASDAIYRPRDLVTGKVTHRTLAEYLRGKNSQTVQELTVLRDSLRQVGRLVAEFGTSPAAAKRAGTPKRKDEESPLMAYVRAANQRMSRKAAS